MKIDRQNFALVIAVASLLILFYTGCSNRATAEVAETDPLNAFAADASDPEIGAAMERIRTSPNSGDGYVRLSAAYIKKARVTGDFGLNRKAEIAIDLALSADPQYLPARRLKMSLLATFHRFEEARAAAKEILLETPNDAFTYGILTDANAELGNYDEAVASAQRMVDIKPNSSSYARVGHIRSLHGDHTGALEMFELALRTADPQDPEAQSWCLVSLGKEYLKRGDLSQAEKALDRALTISPKYNLALIERARILAARGDNAAALGQLSAENLAIPTPDALILMGDIAAVSGDDTGAAHYYELAEKTARGLEGDMHRFALLWADHDTRLDEALKLAETDYQTNKDIYAADIYAWCLFKNGRSEDANNIIERAMRLNTGDARILYHAGMIKLDLGDRIAGKRLLRSALRTAPAFDLIEAEKARRALAAQ